MSTYEGKNQTCRKEIFQFLDDMNRSPRNVQTYDFGSLNNLGTPLLKWEMEKQRVFDSLNNLELEAFRTLQNFRTETFQPPPSLSLPHLQELLMKPFDLNFCLFCEGNYLMVTRCQAMLALLTYTHCLSGLIQFLQLLVILVHERLYWSTFKFQAFLVDKHCMKIKC